MFTVGEDKAPGEHTIRVDAISCPRQECSKFTLSLELRKGEPNDWNNRWSEFHGLPRVAFWRLLPESSAKTFPSEVTIPKAIIADYREACRIRDLSPKASATLARRCLQGMIRDFWKVKNKKRLIDEIQAIEERVDPTTWKAIDAVRSIGNIGAHMEQDVNVIIDVDPGEASALLELIELLIEEWYVARHNREQQVKKVIALGEQKKAEKEEAKAEPEPEEPRSDQ